MVVSCSGKLAKASIGCGAKEAHPRDTVQVGGRSTAQFPGTVNLNVFYRYSINSWAKSFPI